MERSAPKPEDPGQRGETAEAEKVPARQVGGAGGGLPGEEVPGDQRDEKKGGSGDMDPQHGKGTDMRHRPGCVHDPGEQHDRRQARQDERQNAHSVAPGQTSLGNAGSSRGEQQNRKTHRTMKGNDQIARGPGSEGLGDQTCGKGGQQHRE